jgi:AcrR family transcriptional regulator
MTTPAPAPAAVEGGRERRARAQRERILVAAKQCFIEHGFHAASMASIAEVAGMSPGLMYRYFANKSAIVLAIIEEQLDRVRSDIAELDARTCVGDHMLRHVEQWRTRDPAVMSPALVLEMSVEATRDPAIAAAIATKDRETRAAVTAWLSRPVADGGLGLDAEAAASRALLLQCFMEGLAVRTVREPDVAPAERERAVYAFCRAFF